MSENLVAAQAVQQERHMSRWAALTAGVALAAVAITGCSSDGTKKTAAEASASASAAVAHDLAAAAPDCGDTPNLTAEQADHIFGSPDSLFPSFLSKPDASGTQQLVSSADAEKAVNSQLSNDVRVLAVWASLITGPREALQPPDAATLPRAAKILEALESNSAFAAQTLSDACKSTAHLVPTTNFSTINGSSVSIEIIHGQAGESALTAVPVKETRPLSGFTVGYDKDDTNLTDAQRGTYDALQKLILIRDDGTIVINEFLGSTPVEVSKAGAPVSISPSHVPNISVTPSASNEQNPGQSQNQTPNNGGGAAGTGNGSGINTGTQSESQPQGPNGGTKSGTVNQGPKPEASTGTDKTPNNGGTKGTTGAKPTAGPSKTPGSGETPTAPATTGAPKSPSASPSTPNKTTSPTPPVKTSSPSPTPSKTTSSPSPTPTHTTESPTPPPTTAAPSPSPSEYKGAGPTGTPLP